MSGTRNNMQLREKKTKGNVENRAESIFSCSTFVSRTKATQSHAEDNMPAFSRRSTPTWVSVEDLEVTLEGGVPRDDACVVEDGPVTSWEVVHQREESSSCEAQCNEPHHLLFHLALLCARYSYI